ncbi:MAG: ShlB/FhaC/HecB family hemolysin secretion/activation protein [Sideroxyarcus sp.]|nr:ShlB/FhaC/HecB family hemolysin secretion/activation protein [Sideroxyarcus sp.]
MTIIANQSDAAVETTDSEELRKRIMQEAQERERQQQLPSVNLHGEIQKAELFQPPDSETPCFNIQNFTLEVPSQLSPEAHRYSASTSSWDTFRFAQGFLEKYTGRCIGREGINLIVKGVTAKMLERGYPTTRIGIPEQDLSSGTLKLTLIPGIVHELRFADAETPGTWKNAFPTAPGKPLNLRDLEQGLEQMKRVSSQEVDIQIVPAGNLGESDILISVKRGKPWRLIASLDDSGAKGTGKMQAGLHLGWDNPFGANDLFNLGINTDADRNNSMRGTQGNSLSYSIPFGYLTATVSANESTYRQRIMGAVQSFVSSGKSQNLEAKMSYLFHRDQFSKSSLQFRSAKRWSRSYIDDTEVTVQQRNTTLAEIALIHRHNIGQAQLDTTLTYRWGAPWFGAQVDPGNLPGTSPRYHYALETLDTTLTLPFKLNERTLNYSATFRAQNTNTALYASEWFSLGNRWTVRGFDGEYSLGAEKGFFLRNEIGIPIANTLQLAYVGMDIGKVFGENVTNLLGNKLAGIVLGLKGTLARNASFEVFIGRALYKPQNFRTDEPVAGFNLMYQI